MGSEAAIPENSEMGLDPYGMCWAKPTQRCAEGRVAKFSANAGQVLPLTQFDSEPPWESWICKLARLASSCGEGCSRQDKPDFHRRTRRLSTSLCCFFGSIFVPLFSYSFPQIFLTLPCSFGACSYSGSSGIPCQIVLHLWVSVSDLRIFKIGLCCLFNLICHSSPFIHRLLHVMCTPCYPLQSP